MMEIVPTMALLRTSRSWHSAMFGLVLAIP
jgi:hypothetical protein